MSKPVDPADIDFILAKLKELRPALDFRNEKILLTGGTGFFGKWMTQTLLAMNDRWSLGNEIHVLSRDRSKTLQTSPWLNGRKDVQLIEGDVRNLRSKVPFTTILHGAAAASQTLNENQPDEMYGTIVDGTYAVLKLAEGGTCRRFQLVSSGAVYGKQPPDLMNVSEQFGGEPDPNDPRSTYGRAKRVAEKAAIEAQRRSGFHLSIPRCFAFLGPYLPLDIHFAAGNFMNCILQNRPIEIKGDGTPFRSYLYAADLVVWQLVSLLSDSAVQVFNVGSDRAISIRELAELIHSVGSEIRPERKGLANPVVVRQSAAPGRMSDRYVPSVDAAKAGLGVDEWTSFRSAIEKTLRWHLLKA